jgi:hypothetical protein
MCARTGWVSRRVPAIAITVESKAGPTQRTRKGRQHIAKEITSAEELRRGTPAARQMFAGAIWPSTRS